MLPSGPSSAWPGSVSAFLHLWAGNPALYDPLARPLWTLLSAGIHLIILFDIPGR